MHVVNAAVLEQWNTLSDEQVVADVLEGQTVLFEVLMRRHNERVYRAARAIVRDESEAEDVMQQAYVNAYANLRQAEVGAALGISDDAVKTRLSRARAALRHHLMERTRSTAADAFRFYRPRCDSVVGRVLTRITGI
jgi:RNA polymerase sigma-70 factor (ECF subfamily)